jgi:integrase
MLAVFDPHGCVTYPLLRRTEEHAMQLVEFLRTVYVPLRLRGRSPESVRLLEHAVTQFSRWLGHRATIDDLDDLTVSQWLTTRSEKLSALSVARERSGIVAIWNLAQARGLVRLRPNVLPELIPERTPRALTTEELEKLWRSASQVKGWVGPIEASVWFQALLGGLFYSGERITALLSTPRANWQRPWLHVPASARKGGRKPRVYQFPVEVCDLLDKASAHTGPVVLWWHASDTALRKRWKAITTRAGIGSGSDVQFHSLRRSFASHLAAAGGDAREGLGHASEAVTRRYLDPRVANAGRVGEWQMLPKIWEPPADDDEHAIGVA